MSKPHLVAVDLPCNFRCHWRMQVMRNGRRFRIKCSREAVWLLADRGPVSDVHYCDRHAMAGLRKAIYIRDN